MERDMTQMVYPLVTTHTERHFLLEALEAQIEWCDKQGPNLRNKERALAEVRQRLLNTPEEFEPSWVMFMQEYKDRAAAKASNFGILRLTERKYQVIRRGSSTKPDGVDVVSYDFVSKRVSLRVAEKLISHLGSGKPLTPDLEQHILKRED